MGDRLPCCNHARRIFDSRRTSQMSLPSEKSKAPRLQKNGQRQQFLQQTNRNRKNVVSIGFSGSGSQIFHFQSAGERPDALRALKSPRSKCVGWVRAKKR